MEQGNSTVVTSNISSSPGYAPHLSWDSSNLVPAVVLSLCFLLGFPGNIAVLILKPNWQHMSSLSQSLMLNLAVSDLLCLLTLPLWIYSLLYGWAFSLVGCKLLTYIVFCSICGSLLTVTALSIQRYLQVVHLQRSLQVGARKLLALLWLVSMILSIPALVVRQLVRDEHWTKCQEQHSSEGQRMAVVLTETLVGCLSFSVTAFAYINLYRKLNRTVFFNSPQTTRLITSIIVAFFVLWMPYLAINVLGVAAISLKNKDLLKFCVDTWNIVGAVTFVNSTVNPLLYAFTSNHVSTMCQKSAEKLMQNLRFPSKSTDITTVAAS